MAPAFDPYREWLGLDATYPPNHYQLLGLPEFETDLGQIASAADARMKEVRSYQTGPRGKYTQRILNELSSAKLCLLDNTAKRHYDAGLRSRREVAAPVLTPAAHAVSYLMEPPVAPPPPTQLPPSPPPPIASTKATAPRQVPLPRQRVTEESPAGDDEHARWWLPLACMFGLVIALTIATGAYVVMRGSGKGTPKPSAVEPTIVAEVPPPEPGRKDRELPTSVIISQEGSGDLNLPMAAAELSGGLASEPGGQTQLVDWTDDGAATWKFKLVRPAIFKVQIVYAGSKGAAHWQFAAGGEEKQREINAGEQPDKAVTDEFFWRITKAGEQELTLRAVGLPEGANLKLQSLRLMKQDAGRIK